MAETTYRPQHFFFANGGAVGSFGLVGRGDPNDGTVRPNFDVNYTKALDQATPTLVPEAVTRANDTLRTIAARYLGDGNLWYLIAEENGLSNPDAVLVVGLTLRLPNQVISLSNSAGVYKPFSPAQALGDITPHMVVVWKPPGPDRCAQAMMIVVIVAFMIMSFMAAAPATPAVATTTTSTATITTTTGLTITNTATVTATTVASVSTTQAVVSGVVGGAFSSLFSQAAMGAMAVLEGGRFSFNWKAVAASALTRGMTAGLSPAINSMATSLSSIPAVQQAIVGVANNVISQGVNIALKNQKSFDWGGVASAAITAPLTQAMTNAAGPGSAAGVSFASGIYFGAIQTMARGGKVDLLSMAADQFGNMIGDAVASKMAERMQQASAEKARDAELEKLRTMMTERLFAANGGDPSSLVSSHREELYRQQLALLQEGLGDYAKYVGVFGGRDFGKLEQIAADPTRGYSAVRGQYGGDALRDLMLSLGLVPKESGRTVSLYGNQVVDLEFSPGQVAETWQTVKSARAAGLKGANDDLIAPMMLFVRNPDALASQIYMGVLNAIGGYASPVVYENAENQVLALKGSRGLIDVSFGYTQSSAGATLVAVNSAVYQDAERLKQESLAQMRNPDSVMMGPSPTGGAPAAVQNLIGSVALQSLAMTTAFATDPLAPADLRSGARTSLFIDAALLLVSGGSAAVSGIRALRAARTMARMTRLGTVENLTVALRNTSNVEAGIASPGTDAALDAARQRVGTVIHEVQSGARSPVEIKPLNPGIDYYVDAEGRTLSVKTYDRSGFRSGVRDDAWDAAVDPETGLVRDPLTSGVMNKNEPWQMGHKPMMEYWKERDYAINQWLDNRIFTPRKDFLDRLNDPSRYRPELPASNQSHLAEDTSNLFWPW